MENFWFDSWESILRTICLTIAGYSAMVLFLRVSGKRTLSKMNAFDFIITIALGSCLASVSLNKNITLADGVTAFFLLIGLQFLLTWLSVRVKVIRTIITGSPALLFYKGNFLHDSMKKERVSKEEIFGAARQQGIATLDEIDMIIFEPTGYIAIVKKITEGKITTFEKQGDS